MRKNILVEIIKFIYKFASPQNANVIGNQQFLTS